MAGSKGVAEIYENTGDYIKVHLWDFDIGSPYLKPVHKSWLDQYVIAPFPLRNVQVQFTGRASKDGASEWNQALADMRASAASNYVVNRGNLPLDNTSVADSEVQDGYDVWIDKERWRAVVVDVWYT